MVSAEALADGGKSMLKKLSEIVKCLETHNVRQKGGVFVHDSGLESFMELK